MSLWDRIGWSTIGCMQLVMEDKNLQTIDQVRQFLEGSEVLEFTVPSVEERYGWIESVVRRFRYSTLKKAEKGVIRQYLQKVTGYSRAQVGRLIAKRQRTGRLRKVQYTRHRFTQRYTPSDVELLATTDELHGGLSGPATKRILERENTLYGCSEYRKISQISVSHLYTLRKSKKYRSLTTRFTKTRPGVSRIGERKRPYPGGKPGYLRVDTVHQGDREGHKGIYHINAVDEITQWEIVSSVERISEAYLVPVLETMLAQFPFVIEGFHSDNGSEFVNKTVADLLNKLLIRFTKTRPRHTNDNGLVESKNGSIVRKHLGYEYIPQRCAERLNAYNSEFLNPYINFHRPCHFAECIVNDKGKVKKKYPYDRVMTPYEKLRSLPGAESYLRTGVTYEALDAIANQFSDNQFAERMVKARANLFQQIDRGSHTDNLRCPPPVPTPPSVKIVGTSSGSFFD